MIPVDRFRALLGTEGEGKTDDEIRQIRDDAYEYMRMVFGVARSAGAAAARTEGGATR